MCINSLLYEDFQKSLERIHINLPEAAQVSK